MPDTLPDNIAALRALVLTAWAERDAERAQKGRLIEERDQLAGQKERLRQLLRQLQRLQFGRRSEKLDPDQLNLALEDLEQAVAESEAGQEKSDPVLRRDRSKKRRDGARRSARGQVGAKGWVCPIEQRDASFDLGSASPRPMTNLLNLPHTTPPISISIDDAPKPSWLSATTGTKSDATKPASATAAERNWRRQA
jgi:hypothetical protein